MRPSSLTKTLEQGRGCLALHRSLSSVGAWANCFSMTSFCALSYLCGYPLPSWPSGFSKFCWPTDAGLSWLCSMPMIHLYVTVGCWSDQKTHGDTVHVRVRIVQEKCLFTPMKRTEKYVLLGIGGTYAKAETNTTALQLWEIFSWEQPNLWHKINRLWGCEWYVYTAKLTINSRFLHIEEKIFFLYLSKSNKDSLLLTTEASKVFTLAKTKAYYWDMLCVPPECR